MPDIKSRENYVTLEELVDAPNPLELVETVSSKGARRSPLRTIDSADMSAKKMNRPTNTTLTTGVSSLLPSPPDTEAMKETRKQTTVAVGVATGVTGFLLGGPIVGAIAGFTTAAVTKRTLQKREKKALSKYQTELADTLSPKWF